ncbi:lipopolysaccharide biosynthesis protein [Candidatus Sumerlaeota bacterium]|nr:lipopolysaccharide biosynthesis protein [Candidatus Sumerlaeota bacterium]
MEDKKKTLSYLVVVGGFLISLLKIIERSLGLIRLVILARFLAPNDFGLMGVALLTLGTIDTFSQPGFRQALVQKKQNVEEYLNSAWTALIVRGLVLACVLVFVAPLAAEFFDAPKAVLIIRVIALGVLFQAFTNIGVVFFQKELEFNKQFIFQLTGVLADFVVAVSLAILTRSVWALVFGLLAGHFTRMVVSYIIHPFRPRIEFNLQKISELFGFGKWVLGSSILIFLITQGDSIVVGKLVGVVALGLYQMAYRLSNMPATEITHIISQVSFPAYSKLQDDISRLRDAYLKVLSVVAFLTIPLATSIIILGEEFTLIFMGEKWEAMVSVLQLLALAGLFRSVAATAGPVFYAIGKPKLDTSWQIIRLLCMAILLLPFVKLWGVIGAALAVVISIFVTMIGFSYLVIQITHCQPGRFITPIFFPFISSLIIAGVIFATKVAIPHIGIVEFLFLVAELIGIYLLMIYLWQSLFGYNIINLIKENITLFRENK